MRFNINDFSFFYWLFWLTYELLKERLKTKYLNNSWVEVEKFSLKSHKFFIRQILKSLQSMHKEKFAFFIMQK